MKVIVLGSGVIGVASAWYLQAAGHEVTVVDRQRAAALEASFANGGQIAASYALPWANPHAPLQVLRWLGKEDAPLLFRLRADPAQWRWGLNFLQQCLPSRTRHNVREILRLALYGRAQLQALRTATALEYDQRTDGILHFYTERAQFDAAQADARLLAEFGCVRVSQTPQQVVEREPALAAVLPRIVGGDFTPDDESGDAFVFTQRLAALAAERGVQFLYNTAIKHIEYDGRAVTGVRVRHAEADTTLNADAYVVALGSYSPLLLAPLGLRLLVYPVKGYSVTIPLLNPAAAPHISLTDDAYKIVFSRLGERLRVAGTAEFNGYDTSINAVRCEALLKRTAELFPTVLSGQEPAAIERWAGLRPATPSNLPYVGRTRYRNLFVNTGHGTLGWTLACGSGALLADLVSARKPAIDPAGYALSR
jgi:D-amino-acid dehydrogenase